MSLAEHSSKVSHVDDSLQDVSHSDDASWTKDWFTYSTVVSFCWWMNFIQVDEFGREESCIWWEREKKKMKSRRFTSYEQQQVTRLHLRMLQNWFTWQPVVTRTTWGSHSPNGTRVSKHPAATKVQDYYVTNSEQKQLIAKWLCPIWQVQIEIMRNDGGV